jgi:hypothetical protein
MEDCRLNGWTGRICAVGRLMSGDDTRVAAIAFVFMVVVSVA